MFRIGAAAAEIGFQASGLVVDARMYGAAVVSRLVSAGTPLLFKEAQFAEAAIFASPKNS